MLRVVLALATLRASIKTSEEDAPGRSADQLEMDKLKLEAALSHLRKEGKLCVDCAIYESADAAATAVLKQTAGLSADYQLEIAGNIYQKGGKWAYTGPKAGGYGEAVLSTSMIGYHTHPEGDLVFSNKYSSYGATGSSDARWASRSQKTLYLGVKIENKISIGACDFGACPEYLSGDRPTPPTRTIR